MNESIPNSDAEIVLASEDDEKAKEYEAHDHLTVRHPLAATRNKATRDGDSRAFVFVHLIKEFE